MTIGLVWAQSANGVIGRDGSLPWRLPEDSAHFRRTTGADAVVMGRVTWESLPDRFRPLPRRRNIVVTHQASWTAPGAEVFADLPAALRAAPDVWVIGGAGLYAEALPFADLLVVTELEQDFDGDVRAPAIDPSWTRESVEPETGWAESTTGLRYRIVRYRPAAAPV